MEITIHQTEKTGFALATEDGTKAGIMTFSIPSEDYIIIEHTEVETMFNGKGIGKKLLYKIVDMAREKNIKIQPICSYADAVFQKQTDIQDVLKQS